VYHVVSVDRYEKAYDDYSIIMVKALADRLAEVMLRRLTFDVSTQRCDIAACVINRSCVVAETLVLQ